MMKRSTELTILKKLEKGLKFELKELDDWNSPIPFYTFLNQILKTD